MKKTVSLLLVMALMLSLAAPVYAENEAPEYCTVPVKYSDALDRIESLELMIQDGHVYVNAPMLAGRLGYLCVPEEDSVIIKNPSVLPKDRPNIFLEFSFQDTEVFRALAYGFSDQYRAPFPSRKDQNGVWVPFEYTLAMMNSGVIMTESSLRIDIPGKNVLDHMHVRNPAYQYLFDWTETLGYTGDDVLVQGAVSHLINTYQGVLQFDGSSWLSYFQSLVGSTDAYDKKYSQTLSRLLCTESFLELDESIKQVELLTELLDSDGDLGKLLAAKAKDLDDDVGVLFDASEEILEKVKQGKLPTSEYNKSYQALEKALDRQTWFSDTGGLILDNQKEFSTGSGGKLLKAVNVLADLAQAAGYFREFQNHDQFALAALKQYLYTAKPIQNSADNIEEDMRDYMGTLSDDLLGYMAKRYLENVDSWITDSLPIPEALGLQAYGILFVWDIASSVCPFIKDGLSSADNFELAIYGTVFQSDAYNNYVSCKEDIIHGEEPTAEQLYQLAQLYYIFLKSSMITREAAVASLDIKKYHLSEEQLQPLRDHEKQVNQEIAEMLVALKQATETGENGEYGFRLKESEKFKPENGYDEAPLVEWIRNHQYRGNLFGRVLSLDQSLYYWEYGSESFSRATPEMQGWDYRWTMHPVDFFWDMPVAGTQNRLICENQKGEKQVLYEGNGGMGNLAAAGDRIYFDTVRKGDIPQILSVRKDGTDLQTCAEGTICSTNGVDQITVWSPMQGLSSVSNQGQTVALTYHGSYLAQENGWVYYAQTADDGSAQICRTEYNGDHAKILHAFPAKDGSTPVITQAIPRGPVIYLAYGYTDGDPGKFRDGQIVTYDLDQDRTEVLMQTDVPTFSLTEDGTVTPNPGETGTWIPRAGAQQFTVCGGAGYAMDPRTGVRTKVFDLDEMRDKLNVRNLSLLWCEMIDSVAYGLFVVQYPDDSLMGATFQDRIRTPGSNPNQPILAFREIHSKDMPQLRCPLVTDNRAGLLYSQQPEACQLYRIPMVHFQSEDAERINQYLQEKYGALRDQSAPLILTNNAYEADSGGISYEWNVHENLLTLVISNYVNPDQSGSFEYEVILLDLATGLEISQADLLERYPVDREAVKRAIANDFVQTVSIPWGNEYGWLDMALDQYKKSLDPNQPDLQYYLNQAGDLCCIYRKYGGIPSNYLGRCNVTRYEESPDCQRLLDLLQ